MIVVIRVYSPFENKVGLGVFPGEGGSLSRVEAVVTESGGLLVDGLSEVELLDDVSRSEGEVSADNVTEVIVVLTVLDGAVGVNPDG